ncbi:MAG: hypothetical protein IJ383_02405 [Bacteroidales bacterium]|nr:hypothetical protein [Bacteroidales bacterium]
MREAFVCILAIAALFFTNPLAAQQQEEQKSPEEMAIIEAEKLEKELGLTGSQLFFVDSIMRANFTGLSDDMEALRGRGSQDLDSYTTTREKWIQKTIDAFKLVLDDQQYIKYLKYLGKGKEYKKGKDGKYYLKEDLKKQKK